MQRIFLTIVFISSFWVLSAQNLDDNQKNEIEASISVLQSNTDWIVESIEPELSDLKARTTPRQDANGVRCAILKIAVRHLKDVSFEGNIVGEPQYTPGEYFVYVPHGTRKVVLKHESFLPLEIKFSDFGVSIDKETVYKVVVSFVDAGSERNLLKDAFYIDANYQAGSMMGVGASLGLYLSNFNVQIDALKGIGKSEEFAWKKTDDKSQSGYTYTYTAMYMGVNLGYGIDCGHNFHITPQLGIGVSSISGTLVETGNGIDPQATACYVVPASLGVRFAFCIGTNFGISLSPNYRFAVMKTDTYTKLSGLSSKIEGFGSGFVAKAGLFIYF